MEPDPDQQTIELVQRLESGDADAAEELFPRVYEQLHGIAQRMMARERGDHTLQTTALINEAWMRLMGGAEMTVTDREHFVRLAARAMRHVLVDHARRRSAKKRQRERAQPLIEDALAYWDEHHMDLLALHEALGRLAERDESVARVVELRFFGGLTLKETGALLGMSERKAFLAWSFARGWLKRELEKGGADG